MFDSQLGGKMCKLGGESRRICKEKMWSNNEGIIGNKDSMHRETEIVFCHGHSLEIFEGDKT